MARPQYPSRPGAFTGGTPAPGDAGFFSRCSDLAKRFRGGAVTSAEIGQPQAAEQFERVASLLEELERRNAAESAMEGPAAKMGPDELRATRERAGMSVIEFAIRLGVAAGDLDAMEAGRKVIPARFDTHVNDLVARQGPTRESM